MKTNEIKLKRGQLYWYILEIIGATLISGGNPLRPIIPVAIKEIVKSLKKIRNLNVEEAKVRKSLEKLESKEIIDLDEKDGEIFVKIKDKDNLTIIKYSTKALLNFKRKTKKWNKRWFLVFFDVPETQKNKRDYLRRFLIYIGFYQYQKSIYIFPYECENEIKLIKKIVEGAKYIKYIIAEKIEDEKLVKSFFKM